MFSLFMWNNSSKTNICCLKFMYIIFDPVLSVQLTMSSLLASGFSISCTLEHVMKFKVVVVIGKIIYSPIISKNIYFLLLIMNILARNLLVKPLSCWKLKKIVTLYRIINLKQFYASWNLCMLFFNPVLCTKMIVMIMNVR